MKNIIKQRLIDEIKNSGKPLKEIAAEVGITATMLTQYKTTEKLPSLETFAKICKAIDVSADYILGLSDF